MDRDSIIKDFFTLVRQRQEAVSPVEALNLLASGAVIDVNKLVAAGWKRITGIKDGKEERCRGSVWIERPLARESVQCAATDGPLSLKLAISPAAGKPAGAALRAIYSGSAPHRATFRWIGISDKPGKPPALEDFFLPEYAVFDFEPIAAELEAATVEPPPTDLAADIDRQTRELEYTGPTPLTPHDEKIAVLYTMVDQLTQSGSVEAALARLATIGRALILPADSDGLHFMMESENPNVLVYLASRANGAGSPAIATAILGAALLKFWDRLDDELIPDSWMVLGLTAFPIGASALAAEAFARAVAVFAGTDRERNAAHDAFQTLSPYFHASSETAQKPEEYMFVADRFAEIAKPLAGDPEIDLFMALVRVRRAYLDSGHIDATAVDGVISLLEASNERADEAIKKEFGDVAFFFPAAVKSPLEWSALQSIGLGKLDEQLSSYPTPFLADPAAMGDEITREPIIGMDPASLWSGLVPDAVERYDGHPWAVIARMSKIGLRRTTNPVKLDTIDQDNIPYAALLEFYLPKKPASSPVSAIQTACRYRHGLKLGNLVDDTVIPLLPFEHALNKPNARVAFQVYHPWRLGAAADVRVSVEGGPEIVATMPFYAHLHKGFKRGDRADALVAVFPVELTDEGDAPDLFTQDDVFSEWFTRAGVRAVCTVTSVSAPFPAPWGGAPFVRFELAVPGLPFPLPAFYSVDPRIAPGARIAFDGWLYLGVPLDSARRD